MKMSDLHQKKINVSELAVMIEALTYQHHCLKESSNNKVDISKLCDVIAIKQQNLFKESLNENVLKNVIGAVGGGISKAWQGIKSANELKNKLLQAAQDSKPVKNFDAKAEELLNKMKAKLGKASPKALNLLEKYIEWGKKNPVKQSLILAAIVALVSFAATPAAGGLAKAAFLKSVGIGVGSGISTGTSAAAIGGVAGFILKTLNSMLMGEKASSAIAKGAVGGIVGAIAGMGIRQLADMFGDTVIKSFKAATDAGRIETWVQSLSQSVIINTGSETKNLFLTVVGHPDEIEKLRATFDKIQEFMDQGDVENATSLLKSIESYSWKPGSRIIQHDSTDEDGQKYLKWIGNFIGKQMSDISAANNAIDEKQKTFMKGIKILVNGLQAAAQGAATAATYTTPKTATKTKGKSARTKASSSRTAIRGLTSKGKTATKTKEKLTKPKASSSRTAIRGLTSRGKTATKTKGKTAG
jgi:hypothetical protein